MSLGKKMLLAFAVVATEEIVRTHVIGGQRRLGHKRARWLRDQEEEARRKVAARIQARRRAARAQRQRREPAEDAQPAIDLRKEGDVWVAAT